MTKPQHNETIRALAESETYRRFAAAFSQTTGLPVSLTPVDSWQLAHHGESQENPFCALLAQQGGSCAACLRTQHRLAGLAAQTCQTVECPHGLCETAVPVRLGEHLLGFIRTGQVFRRAPTAAGFKRTVKKLAHWGVIFNPAALRAAYFATRVIPHAKYRSMVGLLTFLADHLSVLSNQILMQRDHAESPMISRAKEFIRAHCHEPLTMPQVAMAVHTSTFYFCKQFRRAMGINFVRYVARLRVEKAKNLLLNPHFRISEIAFAVGFQSLTHFNRQFERFAGSNPSNYREQLGVTRNGREFKPAIQADEDWKQTDSLQGFQGNGHANRLELLKPLVTVMKSVHRPVQLKLLPKDSKAAVVRVSRIPLPGHEDAKLPVIRIKVSRCDTAQRMAGEIKGVRPPSHGKRGSSALRC